MCRPPGRTDRSRVRSGPPRRRRRHAGAAAHRASPLPGGGALSRTRWRLGTRRGSTSPRWPGDPRWRRPGPSSADSDRVRRGEQVAALEDDPTARLEDCRYAGHPQRKAEIDLRPASHTAPRRRARSARRHSDGRTGSASPRNQSAAVRRFDRLRAGFRVRVSRASRPAACGSSRGDRRNAPCSAAPRGSNSRGATTSAG